jgi:hypothetical protein
MDDMQSEMSIDSDGDKRWVVNGKLHREDGPAVEWANGDTEWWQHGIRHRTDGPAMEWENGHKEWYLHDCVFSFDKWLDQNQTLTDEEKVMFKLQYG